MPVSTPVQAHQDNEPIWEQVRDCVSGQKAVKEKGPRYLPKPITNDDKKTADERYDQYKQRAMFFNFTARTLFTLVGAAMRKNPVVEVPPAIEYMVENLDNSGNSFNQFSREGIAQVMTTGRVGLLVDYPQADGVLTIEDVATRGLRPYVKPYMPENVINWREDNGMLSLVVLQEKEQVPVDEFTMDNVTRYRVLSLNDAGVYEQAIYDSEGRLIGNPVNPRKWNGEQWREIPFVLPGSINNSPDVDPSPLFDLSVINIAHYRNSADYEEGVYLHGQPMLHIDTGEMTAQTWKDLNPNGVQVGARRGIVTNGGGSASLLQAEANSAAFEALKHKEDQAMQAGARLIEKGGANQTATAVRREAAADHSILSTVVMNWGEAMTRCLKWACEYVGADPEQVSVEMNTEFFDEEPDPQMMAQMLGFYSAGVYPSSVLTDYGRKVGHIDSDTTDEDLDDENSEDVI